MPDGSTTTPSFRVTPRAAAQVAAIAARDERETGDRALLNLGHTFGHALEAATGFSDRLFHGEGVSIGMVLAAARAGMGAALVPAVLAGDDLAAGRLVPAAPGARDGGDPYRLIWPDRSDGLHALAALRGLARYAVERTH